MKALITILIFSSTFITFSQEENQISSSSLIGNWNFERVVKGVHYDTVIYTRSNSDPSKTEITFSDQGVFVLNRNRGRRCGNEKKRNPTIEGTFSLDIQSMELKLTSSSSNYYQTWYLLWIDDTSFAFKRTKSRLTYN